MPRRWKRSVDEVEVPQTAPAAITLRGSKEDLMRRLWAGDLKSEEVKTTLAPQMPQQNKGYPAADLRTGEAFFPVMSQEELELLQVPAEEPERIRKTFEDYGVCIVTDVISPEDCAALEDLWHDDLLRLLDESKVLDAQVAKDVAAVKEDVKAWPKHWDQHLGSKGMASKHSLPHGSFAWAARLHPKIRQVFANLYGTEAEDLAVGLDNVFWASAEETSTDRNPEWLHVDQNHRTGMTWTCAQGVLYVWPTTSTSSSTVVWPKSHKEAYEKMMEDPEAIQRGRSKGGQSVKLRELQAAEIREELLGEALQKSRRVPCPAGSLLLWDSRTVHQGWRGGPRLAMPICWEPKSRRSEEALRRKLWMSLSGVPSSHSAAEGRVHGMAKEAHRPSLEDGLPLLRASLLPFGISANQEEEWLRKQPALWPSDNPKRQAECNDLKATLPLLRAELLEVL